MSKYDIIKTTFSTISQLYNVLSFLTAILHNGLRHFFSFFSSEFKNRFYLTKDKSENTGYRIDLQIQKTHLCVLLSALKMIGKENGAAVSSRISNVRRRSLVQGSGSAVRFFGTKKPLKSDIRTVEGHLTEPKQTNKIITGDTKKWKKTTNSFEMSVLKKQKQAKKEVRYVFMKPYYFLVLISYFLAFKYLNYLCNYAVCTHLKITVFTYKAHVLQTRKSSS